MIWGDESNLQTQKTRSIYLRVKIVDLCICELTPALLSSEPEVGGKGRMSKVEPGKQAPAVFSLLECE